MVVMVQPGQKEPPVQQVQADQQVIKAQLVLLVVQAQQVQKVKKEK